MMRQSLEGCAYEPKILGDRRSQEARKDPALDPSEGGTALPTPRVWSSSHQNREKRNLLF